MNGRQREIINFLVYSSSPQKISDFRKKTLVSERTIKYDLATIRKELSKINVELLNKKGLGYYLSPENKSQVLLEYSFNCYENGHEQADFFNIMLYFLCINNSVKLEELSDSLYFDERLIKSIISNNEKSLPKDIYLRIEDKATIRMVGTEKSIRLYFLKELTNIFKTHGKMNIMIKLQKQYPIHKNNLDTEYIEKVETQLQNSIEKWNIWISEKSYISLVLYLQILHLRKNDLSNNLIKEKKVYSKFKNEYFFADSLLTNLFGKDINNAEILNFVEIMIENNVFIDIVAEGDIESKLKLVTNKIINRLKESYSEQAFNYSDFIEDIVPHFKQIIRRHDAGIDGNENPLFFQIKQKYNESYILAQKLYQIFCEEFQIPFSENEVSYLTIYLYKNTSLRDENKYSIFIVCGTGRGFSKLLKTKIMNRFDNIQVIECLSSFHLLKEKNLKQVDFIVSTIDLPEVEVPVVKITSFLGQEDIQNIQYLMEYGTPVSSIPIPRKKKESIVLTTNKINKKKEIASIFSGIFLELINMMVDLPPEYQVDQEKILGITIHLIIALPRYYDDDLIDTEIELIEEVKKTEKNNPELHKVMSIFLSNTEKLLGVGIPYSERYALYKYIIN